MDLKDLAQLASALLDAVTAALALAREALNHRRAREAPRPEGAHFAPEEK